MSANLRVAPKLQLQQDNAADRLRLAIPEAPVDHLYNVTVSRRPIEKDAWAEDAFVQKM